LLKAAKQDHLSTCSGVTEDTINNNLKLMPGTAMGHVNQKQQNIRPTSKAVAINSDV
jgi:hypothetical protein